MIYFYSFKKKKKMCLRQSKSMTKIINISKVHIMKVEWVINNAVDDLSRSSKKPSPF